MVTSNAASGYVAKISMLRLNIGSGILNTGPPPATVSAPRLLGLMRYGRA